MIKNLGNTWLGNFWLGSLMWLQVYVGWGFSHLDVGCMSMAVHSLTWASRSWLFIVASVSLHRNLSVGIFWVWYLAFPKEIMYTKRERQRGREKERERENIERERERNVTLPFMASPLNWWSLTSAFYSSRQLIHSGSWERIQNLPLDGEMQTTS